MNRQEIYDRVKAHLLTQGKKALDPENENCLYRAPGGLKCAIGCLISDEAYHSVLEMLLVSDEPVQKALSKSGIKIESEEDEGFLTRLQQIHDMADVASWARQLMSHATKYGLTP